MTCGLTNNTHDHYPNFVTHLVASSAVATAANGPLTMPWTIDILFVRQATSCKGIQLHPAHASMSQDHATCATDENDAAPN